MNILIVAQCDKSALKQSRRILDQFAERKGDRTWQTAITAAGLDALKKLLRASARKNTAVACHLVRGKDHTELIWIVGDRRRFNEVGTVATNETKRDVLKNRSEINWRNSTLMASLTSIAALMHDLGKACAQFQKKLRAQGEPAKNIIRHEWISLRLFQSFVVSAGVSQAAEIDGDPATGDTKWLKALANCVSSSNAEFEKFWLGNLERDGLNKTKILTKPLDHLKDFPLARVVGWLIVTHHRLPRPAKQQDLTLASGIKDWSRLMGPQWNEKNFDDLNADVSSKDWESYWTFKNGLPIFSEAWRKTAALEARRISELSQRNAIPADVFDDPFVMHLSRLSLILADHEYSKLNCNAKGEPDPRRVSLPIPNSLFANTYRNKESEAGLPSGLNQGLDEHLVGVSRFSKQASSSLPGLRKLLPSLGHHKAFLKRSKTGPFSWQNKAVDEANRLQQVSQGQGAFVVNLASTGKGKTLANAKIMYALSDPAIGMRCAFALGLRTLTLQTGKALRERLFLDESQLAIRVGNPASRELFELQLELAERTGSASTLSLTEEDSPLEIERFENADPSESEGFAGIDFEGTVNSVPILERLLHGNASRVLLEAPLLSCTIDHLTPATEATRGGRQIIPMLRLLTSDLVLDEPDDFDTADFPALARLVNWAGMLGAKVLLSSASLPPSMVEGLFDAYLVGRKHFEKNAVMAGDRDTPSVPCLLTDEFNSEIAFNSDTDTFRTFYEKFTEVRVSNLIAQPSARKLSWLPVGDLNPKNLFPELARRVLAKAQELHLDNASLDPISKKRVSFGLCRIANIKHLVHLAKEIFKVGAVENFKFHLCVYHSRFALAQRSAIERVLDKTLNRSEPDAVFSQSFIQAALRESAAENHVFIVIGSPVTEVGRDHDYDWAIVEPSSGRSLIQLIGRVRRHRQKDKAWSQVNVVVLTKSIRGILNPAEEAFKFPGFELKPSPTVGHDYFLTSHELPDLIPLGLDAMVDARTRVHVPPAEHPLKPNANFLHLEHFRTGNVFKRLPKPIPNELKENAALWWSGFEEKPSRTLTSSVLQALQPFRYAYEQDSDYVVVPRGNADPEFILIVQDPKNPKKVLTKSSNHSFVIDPVPEIAASAHLCWGPNSYTSEIEAIAEEKDIDVKRAAMRYGGVSLGKRGDTQSKWNYHERLGFFPSGK